MSPHGGTKARKGRKRPLSGTFRDTLNDRNGFSREPVLGYVDADGTGGIRRVAEQGKSGTESRGGHYEQKIKPTFAGDRQIIWCLVHN
jgi:hypothetical protein